MDFLKERLRELINEKNYNEAIEVLEKLEKSEEVDFLTGEIYEAMGYANEDNRMFESAIDMYSGLKDSSKYGKTSIIRISYIYEYALDDIDKALDVVRKNLDEDEMEYLLRTTEIQYKKGEYSKIIFCLSKFNPNNLHPKLIYRLGKSHRKLNDKNRAISYFKYLISNYRNHPYSLTAWGYMFMDKEKYEDAVMYFKEAIDRDFYNVVIHYNYLKCLFNLDRFDEISSHVLDLKEKGMYCNIYNEYLSNELKEKIVEDLSFEMTNGYYRDSDGEYVDY